MRGEEEEALDVRIGTRYTNKHAEIGDRGDRKGQHSLRINDQYRVCFTWTKDGASGVEIVDYH
jgi:plasmid maintenance system killer protein